MSSEGNSSKSKSNEESLRYFKQGKDAFEKKEFQKSVSYLVRSIKLNPNYKLSYCVLADAYSAMKDFAKAEETISTCIKNLEATKEKESMILLNLRNLLLTVLENLNKKDKMEENIREMDALIKSFNNSDQEILNTYIERVKDYKSKKTLKEIQSLESRKNEAKSIKDLIDRSNNDKSLTEEGFPVHIVSNRWFKAWKKYTNFHQLFPTSKADKDEEIEENGNEITDALMANEENVDEVHPGAINQDDILEDEDNLIDPDKIKDYCNYVLKKDIQENKQFVILGHKVWKDLHKIYGGKEIKRLIISINDESNLTQVEIWLKKVNLMIIPLVHRSKNYDYMKVESVYLSKKETIKDLKEKINRIYKANTDNDDTLLNTNNCRILVLDQREQPEDFKIKIIQSRDKPFLFKGKRLEENLALEECNLVDTDILVVEYRGRDGWVVSLQESEQKYEKNKCANCGTTSNKLSICECRQVKYCDEKCQKYHRPQHKDQCLKIKKEMNSTNDIVKSLGISMNKSKPTSESRNGLVGLQNLGNTCFMNSSLQCLSNVFELSTYFYGNDFIKDINKTNPLGTGGYLAGAYGELMKDIWLGNEGHVAPWDLKRIIGKFAPQFSGYNQQDSQELLSYLLDGLHEDLNRVRDKPIVETIESNNQPDPLISKQSWENYLKRNKSFVIELFAGQYKSTIVCPDCNRVSITFDPFLSVSLPIPSFNFISANMYFIFRNSNRLPFKLNMTVQSSTTVKDLFLNISEITEISDKHMQINLIKDHKIIEICDNTRDFKYLKDHDGIVFVYEIWSKDIDFKSKKALVRTVINIYHESTSRNNHGEEKEVSYSRIIYANPEIILEDYMIQVYKTFRPFIKNCIEASKVNIKEKMIEIDIDNFKEEDIRKEFEFFFAETINTAQEYKSPYDLFWLNDNNDEIRLKVSNGKANFEELLLKTKASDEQKCLNFKLKFHEFFRIEHLKLNRCQEAPNSSKSNEQKCYSLQECLDLFTKEEILEKGNEWYCSKCKEHKQASKKMELYKTPDILILHLKRFKTSKISSIGNFYYTSGSSKITTPVSFPLKELDLGKYVIGKGQEEEVIYDLFAISNHYGSLGGGHYTAFCKNYLKDQWYDFDDSRVSKFNEDSVVSEAAYVLFYRKRKRNRTFEY